ncbi:MAG TPA: SLC13 family permease, partial [Tepidisphaeraceae bacterium]
IMLVFACNNGSAMSSVGNPIGVLIALKTGLSFMDFLIWAAPVALVVDLATFFICRWWFADSFAAFGEAVSAQFAAKVAKRELASVAAGGPSPDIVESEDMSGSNDSGSGVGVMDNTFYDPTPISPSIDAEARRNYRICWAILLGLILLLVTHGLTERGLGWIFNVPRMNAEGMVETTADGKVIFGLKEGTMMVAAALLMGSVVLLLAREKARELVERRIDWWTLSFFMMLFASVGTLQHTAVTNVIASKLSSGGSSTQATIQIVGWATGWLSAFLDNVLAVATFMPVVHDIRAAAGPTYTSAIYWFMLFGGTFMGNMTIIGSTANIVAVGLLEKRGHGTIGFGYWMKIGFLVSIASMLIATVMLLAMNHLGMPTLPNPGLRGGM